jgi:D-glycero-alpha-D-manno-heptose-7-phosphate kinase
VDRVAPIRIINSVAPMRICDIGGWTDTWFAGHGRVFSIAVYPYAEVQLRVFPIDPNRPRIVIHAENYDTRYSPAKQNGMYDKHPLLEAALEHMGVPENLAIEVGIFSEIPGGCSTGTSAAVSVALIGALDFLTPGRMTPYEVAMAAHRIETDLLKQECGVQDQLASAYGGINLIEMHQFPHAAVSPLQVPNSVWWELESRLALIFIGRPHSSSDVHRLVIRELEDAGPDSPKLAALRSMPSKARDALYAGDYAALGRSMIENTEAQAALHPALVSEAHRAITEIAKEHGAVGWKVNGAGGDGGSVSILCSSDPSVKRSMVRAIQQADAKFKHIPIYLSRFGLRCWETQPDRAVTSGYPGQKG